MALFSAVVLVFNLAVMPALPVASSATGSAFCEQLGNRKLQVGLTLLLVAGHFMAFTFVRPLLLSVSGFETQWIGALLFAYGIAGIIGNFIAGMVAARRTVLTLMAISLGLLLTPVLFLTVGDSHIGGGVVLLVWGLAYGGVSVCLMTWVMKAAPRAVEIATALYSKRFQCRYCIRFMGGRPSRRWTRVDLQSLVSSRVCCLCVIFVFGNEPINL